MFHEAAKTAQKFQSKEKLEMEKIRILSFSKQKKIFQLIFFTLIFLIRYASFTTPST